MMDDYGTLYGMYGTFNGIVPQLENITGFKMIGDSMAPDVPAEALVTVDKSLVPETGDAVMVDHEGRLTCRWYKLRPDGSRRLTANQHQEPVEPNDRTKIIGVVVSVWLDLPHIPSI